MEANEIPTWRAGLTIALAAAGETERARRSFEVSMAEDLAALPRDMWWVATVALVAEGCASLGDAERARRHAGSRALIVRTHCDPAGHAGADGAPGRRPARRSVPRERCHDGRLGEPAAARRPRTGGHELTRGMGGTRLAP
jgi:hypothetical protein